MQNRTDLVKVALSFIPIVVIQLYEALLYRYCKSLDASRRIRNILLFTICLQPIALYVGAVQCKQHNLSPYLNIACGGILVAYVASLVLRFPTVKAAGGCGKWEFDDFNIVSGALYHVLLLLSLLIPRRGGVLLFTVGILTFLTSLLMGEHQPSKWCLLAAITPICLSFT
jgi:hypothetical protein